MDEHTVPQSQLGDEPMRKVIAVTLIAASLMLSACNTVKGLGRDIESVGEAGDKAI
jgi:predicted small secreted protein